MPKIYTVKVVREAGDDPITGEYYERAEELLEIEADNPQKAYIKAGPLTTLKKRLEDS